MTTRSVDYLAKDFDSIVDALITYATVNYGTNTAGNRQWTSFNVDDFSRTWLELVAYVGDLIFFYLDVQATQSTLETATLRQAVLNIAKQFGYYVSTSTSASGTATFTLSAAGSNQTIIPAGTRLTAQNGAEFFTKSEFKAETLVVDVEVLQGTQRIESFKARGVQNEEIVLGYSSMVIDQAITDTSLYSPIVKINGDPYTLVNTFIRSLPTDTHYKVSIDSSGKGTIIFGDGVFGRQLSPNDFVQVEYRTGGGTIGNIPLNTLTTLTDPLNFVVSVTNLEEFSGGTDEESIDQLKATIPYSLSTLERAVTTEDYANVVLANFSNVAKASAAMSTDLPAVDIDVFIVPSGSTITNITDNTILYDEIRDFLDKRKLVTTTFSLKDAYGIDILLKLLVYLSTGASRTVVQTNITEALVEFFNLNTGDIDNKGTKFAQQIKLKDLQSLISSIEGIERFEFLKSTYRPNVVKNTGLNYLVAPIEIYPNCEELEWLVGAEYSADSPVNNPYTVFKKINGTVTSLDTDSLTDTLLNLAVLESTSTGVSTGASNILYDSSKTFLTNQYATNYLLIDIANNVWSITSNDAHSFTLSANALNGTVPATEVTSGNYKIVKSYIGENILFNGTIFPGIEYNTHNTVYLVGSGFDVVGTIGDNFEISIPQTATGVFGVPATVTSFTEATPSAGYGRFQCAGDPDLSDVSNSPSDYVLVTSALESYNVYAADDIMKTVDIFFDSAVTADPTVSSLGTPITITKPYYPDNNEFCMIAGLADYASGSGISAFGTIVIDSALTKANIPNNTIFTIKDIQKNIIAGGAVRVYDIGTFIGTTTITTSTAHGLSADDYVLISGVTDSSFNNAAPVKVLTTPSSKTFTFAQPLLASATSGGGTITRISYFVFRSPVSTVSTGSFSANITDVISAYEFVGAGSDNSLESVFIDISDTADAEDIKTNIVEDINVYASGDTHFLVDASDGNAQMAYVTDEVVKLIHGVVGTGGNLPIELISSPISGLEFNGLSGGLNSGHSVPVPIIPGSGDSVTDYGKKLSNGDDVDNLVFKTSKYLGDIANLRSFEIPQLGEEDIEYDLRGGIE